MKSPAKELPIIQKTYDFILWFVPLIGKLPRDHKFLLGDRIISGLYGLLEELILARYATDKLSRLEPLNGTLDILRYQTRLLRGLSLIDQHKYELAAKQIDEIGRGLSGWIRQQKSTR